MAEHPRASTRCARCRVSVAACICHAIGQLTTTTHVALVMHHRQWDDPYSSGPLALEALANSARYLHGRRDKRLDLSHLHERPGRLLVLFPSEDARPLPEVVREVHDEPLTLVLPAGSWRQARRICRRIPGLARATRVSLPDVPPSAWAQRWQPNAAGLPTLEALARALGIVESASIEGQLDALFKRLVEAAKPDQASIANKASATDARARPPLEVLLHDEHLIAVNKPAGVPSHPGWARTSDCVLHRLRDQVGHYLYPVHRLDAATSGVLIFARTSEVARDMQLALGASATQKRYLALCRGHDPELTSVDHPLKRDAASPPRAARTELRLLGCFERYGLYEALPRNGRTHQIRRHLKHAAHPIIGDVRYGKGEHNRLFRERFGFSRMALHCQRISFVHPRDGNPITVEAKLPLALAQLLGRLDLSRCAQA